MKQLSFLGTLGLLTLGFPTPTYANHLPTVVKAGIIDKIQAFITEYNILINGIWGVLTIAAVGVFIIHFIKLGQYSTMPLTRNKVMRDILISGICTAMLGSFWFVYIVLIRLAMG